jgi:hypothetical protein
MKKFFKNLFGGDKKSNNGSSDDNGFTENSAPGGTNWKDKFDSEIYKHENLLQKHDIQNESNSAEKPTLIYENGKKYDSKFFKRSICSKIYSEDHKIRFLKQSIEDNNYGYLKYEYSFVSKIFLEEKSLATFLFEHYKQEDAKDSERGFRHVEFAIKNQLSNSKEIIDNYLRERPGYKRKYILETAIPVCLFNLGYQKEAVDLLEFFVNEQEKGNGDSIHDGNHEERSNPFALIGLSGNLELTERVNRLAFRYFKNITMGYTYGLSEYLRYIDLPEYQHCLKFWLKKYPELDQTNSSNITGYKSLIGGEGKYIAEEMGMDYWNLFLSTQKLWDADEFERTIPDVAQFVMSPSLPDKDKKEIIDYTLNHLNDLRSDNDNTDSFTFKRYIQIILKTKKDISEKEIEAYVPPKYNKYGGWAYVLRDIYDSQHKPDLYKIKSDFLDAKLIEDFKIDAYTRFQNSLGQFSIYKFLDLTNRIIGFDAEGGMFPLNYTQLFEESFRPVLEASGLSRFRFFEEQERLGKECLYTLAFQLDKVTYETSFQERSDWYNVSKMSLIINRCLIEVNSELRMISVDTGDQSALLGLFKPDSFIPLMLKYNIRCWAIDGDNLVEMNYC